MEKEILIMKTCENCGRFLGRNEGTSTAGNYCSICLWMFQMGVAKITNKNTGEVFVNERNYLYRNEYQFAEQRERL
ncbi:hypothetical protein LCGC14_0417740 [marine sediment metagenome]|uniref:Uncharacterized protein n=1 Tax=marine sediment metagenome TaxID=412755 RepID=A0A0F9W0U3_9ZZZZ